MKYIAILLTVHNRKAKTLECLEYLYAQQNVAGYEWEVYLTDDGCTDCTAEEVARLYPTVNIIKGDGNLYWNRGMYTAWKAAVKAKDYDFYLWLNDDTLLFPNAIKQMLQASDQTNFNALICGATCSKDNNSVTYSGWLHNQKQALKPNGQLQECNIVNGNFLLWFACSEKWF